MHRSVGKGEGKVWQWCIKMVLLSIAIQCALCHTDRLQVIIACPTEGRDELEYGRHSNPHGVRTKEVSKGNQYTCM